MNESTARAERIGPASPAPGVYLWEVAQKPVSVKLSLDLVERLEHEVVESFRSLDSRGSEIGGVLLGSAQSGNPARVSIEGYELIPCDYARGPLYRFSEADVERFEKAIAQHNGSGGQRVVGFFRSHTRKGLGLDAEDLAFFTPHFREPHQVALLIRPYASKASTAGIFIWENGTIKGEASYQEFPFRRADLQNPARPETSEPAAESPAGGAALHHPAEPAQPKPPVRAQIVPIASRREIALPPPPPVQQDPAPKMEAPAEPEIPARAEERPALEDIRVPLMEKVRGGRTTWIVGGVAAALLLAGGTLIYPGLSHKSKPAAPAARQDSSALSLRVERSAGDLLLTWNRESDAIKNAAHGTLSIVDGDQHENVALDVSQLRTGSIAYTPSTGDVEFQLAVTGQNSAQVQSESLRVLRTRPSPMPDGTQAAAAATAPATAVHGTMPAQPAVTASTTPAPTAAGTPASASTPVNTAVAEESKPAVQTPPLKEFHAESLSARLRPARPSDLPDAPGIDTAAPAAAVLPGVNLNSGLPLPPPPKAPPAPPASARTGKRATPAEGGQIQQAQLLSHKNPDYPMVARQTHVEGVVVISATVGTDGKVKSARAVSGPALLRQAAVDAVKQWIYRPTLLNGMPVESETRVEIRFTNDR